VAPRPLTTLDRVTLALRRLGEDALGVCVTEPIGGTMGRLMRITTHFALPGFFARRIEETTADNQQPRPRGWTTVLLSREFSGRFRIFRDKELMLARRPHTDWCDDDFESDPIWIALFPRVRKSLYSAWR